jgi:hypothetical protein
MQGVGLRKDGLLVHESVGDGQLSEGAPTLIRPAAHAIDLRDGGKERPGMTLANTAALRQSLVMRGYEELWRVRLLGTRVFQGGMSALHSPHRISSRLLKRVPLSCRVERHLKGG